MFRIQVLLSTALLSVVATTGVAAFAQEDTQNIFEQISGDEDLSTLESVLTTANIEDSVAFTNDITILAPTNEAFAALPPEVTEALLREENRAKLLEILRYHVVLKDLDEDDLEDSSNLVTLLGTESTVEIMSEDGSVVVNTAVSTSGFSEDPSNGSILKIDSVLIPEGFDIDSLTMVTEATPRTGGISISPSIFFALVLLSGGVFSVKELM